MAVSSGFFGKTKNDSDDTGLRQKETEYQWGHLPAPEK